MTALPDVLHPDDLLRFPDEDWYELLDGRPTEKVKGAYSSFVCGHLTAALGSYIDAHRLGHVFGSRTGYHCFPGRPRHLRRPDASFVTRGRFPDERVPDYFCTISPDLCVEVAGPDETCDQMDVKVSEFLHAGVRLYWIISPATRTILVRRPDKSCQFLDVSDTLTGEDGLPGFACPVAELFA